MFRKMAVSGILLALLCAPACNRRETPPAVDLDKREAVALPAAQPEQKPLRFAVGGMITPKEGLAYYRDFLDYIGEKLGRHVEFVDRDDYGEINDLLMRGNLEVAFVCSGPYVDGHAQFGLELLAAPEAYGAPVYYAYIIVGKGNRAARLEDLRGKSFAFTDPLSNTGKLVPTYMLAKMGETPDSFFGKVVFTRTHDKAIRAVAQGLVDGASVDSLIWEYQNRTDPRFTSQTRILIKSPPYGIPPVAVPKDLDRGLKDALRKIFLDADKDARGKELLGRMMIDRFVPIADNAYDSVREMRSWVDRQARKEPRKRAGTP